MIIQDSAVIAIAAIWQSSSFPFHPCNLPGKGPASHSHKLITVVPLVSARRLSCMLVHQMQFAFGGALLQLRCRCKQCTGAMPSDMESTLSCSV